MDLRRILVATDFSDHAAHAMRKARLVGGANAEYRLVHVMPLLLASVRSPMLSSKDRARFAEADSQAVNETIRVLKELAEGLEAPTSSVQLLHGSVGSSVAHAADEYDADLVVVGAGDHARIEKILLGSKAKSILRSAPTDVLVVRRASPESPPPYKRILVATDFSEAAQAAATRARAWAKDWKASLDLVHCVDPELWWHGRVEVPPLEGAGSEVPDDLYRQVMKATLHDFNTSVCDGEAEEHLVVDRPVDGTVRTAQDRRADLVVVGTHAPGFLERVFLGSVAYGVATHAKADVLVVRKPSGEA